MNKFILFIAVFLTANGVFAQTQNALTVTVKNEDTKTSVAEAEVSVKDTEIVGKTNANGQIKLQNIPDGEQIIVISSPGFETLELKLTFPLADSTERIVFLHINNDLG